MEDWIFSFILFWCVGTGGGEGGSGGWEKGGGEWKGLEGFGTKNKRGKKLIYNINESVDIRR